MAIVERTLKVRLNEHTQVVKHENPENGIAVHAHESNHVIDWDGARVKRSGMTGYWQRRTTVAIHIKLSGKTMKTWTVVYSCPQSGTRS